MKDEKTGEDLVSIGFVVELDYADATTSAHDLLQQFKTAPAGPGDPRGRRARRLGRQGAAGRRLLVDAQAVDAGRAAGRRLGRHGRHDGAQGRPPLHQVGHARGEAIYAALKRGETSLESYEDAVEESLDRQGAVRGPQRAASRCRRACSSAARSQTSRRSHQGQAAPGRAGVAPQRRACRCSSASTKDSYPKPDGKYTFDKLSSVFITGNATRDDAPNHIRVQKHVPREVAETWRWMCPAGVYEIPEDAPENGNVDVIVNYTNCVQCGAITAKGGRLTTPEGGDGPLYQHDVARPARPGRTRVPPEGGPRPCQRAIGRPTGAPSSLPQPPRVRLSRYACVAPARRCSRRALAGGARRARAAGDKRDAVGQTTTCTTGADARRARGVHRRDARRRPDQAHADALRR